MRHRFLSRRKFRFHLKENNQFDWFVWSRYSYIIYFNISGWPLRFPIRPVAGRYTLTQITRQRTVLFDKTRKKNKINQNQRNVGFIPKEKAKAFATASRCFSYKLTKSTNKRREAELRRNICALLCQFGSRH